MDSDRLICPIKMLQHWLLFEKEWRELSDMKLDDIEKMFSEQGHYQCVHLVSKFLEFEDETSSGYFTRLDMCNQRVMLSYFFPRSNDLPNKLPDPGQMIAKSLMNFFLWADMRLFGHQPEFENLPAGAIEQIKKAFEKWVRHPIKAFDSIENDFKHVLLQTYARIENESATAEIEQLKKFLDELAAKSNEDIGEDVYEE